MDKVETLNFSSEQKASITRLRSALESARDRASKAWHDFDSERTAAVSNGADLSTSGSPEFKRLDTLHATYTAQSAEVTRLQDELSEAILSKSSSRSKSIIATQFMRKAIETKALDQTTGSIAVSPFYDDLIYANPSRPTLLLSQAPREGVDGDKVVFTRQTAKITSAGVGMVAPHGVKPTTTVGIERIEEDVVVTATKSEALDRSLLKDHDGLQNFVSSKLVEAVLLKVEEQIISGDGTGENFTGILSTPGILTVARGGSEDPWEAIYRAILAVQGNFIDPTVVALNPNDWATIRLAKDANGRYLSGEVVQSDPQKIWGLPVVVTPAITEGTGLVGNVGAGAKLWSREEAFINWTAAGKSDVDGEDLFEKNEFRALAEMRSAFGVIHAGAFCEVTSL